MQRIDIAEVGDLLQQPWLATLATYRKSGQVLLSPVWFEWTDEAFLVRQLGRSGLTVSAVGFGAMSLAGVYGPADDAESVNTLRRAIELGVTLFDTADIYGDGRSERLLGQAIEGRRKELVVATKFGGGFN